MITPGPRNQITDVSGLKVGNDSNAHLKSGTTVLLGDKPFTAAVHVMGGAPGTRESDLLSPDKLVQEVDALVLSGGSAFGLDAASGVADGLRAMGRGFSIGDQLIPIVPGAILFDLLNGGDKNWDKNPYNHMGQRALIQARQDFEIGTVGAGTGATSANLMGGLGTASLVLDSGHTVGALVAVNPLGSVTVGDSGHFWAAPFEMNKEFGGLGPAATGDFDPEAAATFKGGPGQNTTIAIVATDAVLTQAQTLRMATAAHDGMARSIVPSHTPFDGDLVFGVSTGEKPLKDPLWDPLHLGDGAARCLARAIARGVYAATPASGNTLPTWHQVFAH